MNTQWHLNEYECNTMQILVNNIDYFSFSPTHCSFIIIYNNESTKQLNNIVY